MIEVAHLERYWSRTVAKMSRPGAAPRSAEEWARDKLLLHGLGVGLEQAARYLAASPSFEDFEQWIADRNGGAIDPARLRRLNAALLAEPYDAATTRWLASIDALPPVLTAADLAQWNEEGFVIVRGAVSQSEAEEACAAVYETVGADPADAGTWYSRRNMQGIMVQMFQHPAFQPARTSPRIHKALAQLWGTVDLFATTDRGGFNPPERDGFCFPGPNLHWDSDLTRPVPFDVQGVLYLVDVEAEQGAFTCIPRFHRELEGWLRGLPRGANPADHIPKERAVAVAASAGDLILWHRALPHGSRPNRAARPRVVQYLTMFPPLRIP
ncbi:MAG TPA: phytanoyl-CoA dioxygenase family protein [Thermoanaerobaculia bacterium]|nr:phytanoyl-CoA dioxygenase family protein [Thermoanaerobaculia bacterium]